MLKVDLEGGEYALLNGAQRDELRRFMQIFGEFHHHAVVALGNRRRNAWWI